CAKGVKFRVDTTTESPVFSRPYRMNPIAAKNTNKLVKELLDEGVIQPTTSPWASPAFVVPKRDGSGRLVVDYRKLNKITIPDRYRSPTIEEILGGVSEGAHFSVIDLRKGFHQVEVEEASQAKLAFMIGNKQYTFRIMAMGPRNAPACFQRAVDAALGTLLPQCCFVYLDDIIIYTPKGKGRAGHLADVKRTLRALDLAGFTTRVDKCKFGLDSLDYLQGGQRFRWEEREERAYVELVQALLDEPVLTSPDWEQSFKLEVDASKEAIGGILSQNGRVISYGSHRLTEAERRWSATEREIYAGVFFTRKFAYYLSNSDFTLFTDSRPFSYLMKQRDPHGRFARWIAALQQFGGMTVQCRTGVSNVAADSLSRDIEVEFAPIETRIRTLDGLKKAQDEDEDCQAWRRQ
ncbi:hypothetical protein FOZ63_008512, partial [Perkinsus olseni]